MAKPLSKQKSALHELADYDFLERNWRDFYSNTPKAKRNSSGIDGVSFLKFNSLKQENIQRISNCYKEKLAII